MWLWWFEDSSKCANKCTKVLHQVDEGMVVKKETNATNKQALPWIDEGTTNKQIDNDTTTNWYKHYKWKNYKTWHKQIKELQTKSYKWKNYKQDISMYEEQVTNKTSLIIIFKCYKINYKGNYYSKIMCEWK